MDIAKSAKMLSTCVFATTRYAQRIRWVPILATVWLAPWCTLFDLALPCLAMLRLPLCWCWCPAQMACTVFLLGFSSFLFTLVHPSPLFFFFFFCILPFSHTHSLSPLHFSFFVLFSNACCAGHSCCRLSFFFFCFFFLLSFFLSFLLLLQGIPSIPACLFESWDIPYLILFLTVQTVFMLSLILSFDLSTTSVI